MSYDVCSMRCSDIPNIKDLIIKYLCEDMTQEQIAKKLGYSVKSIHKYTEALRLEHGVKTTPGLVAKYLKTKLS